jgi:MFS family permease
MARPVTTTPPVSGRASVAQPVPWYRLLDRHQWNTLLASNLGWLFDGYETYALILTVAAALRELLNASDLPRLPFYAGAVIATTLFGWGVGGILGGIIADYLGRKRMMMYSILAYATLTGLSALAWSWESFAILRPLVAGTLIGVLGGYSVAATLVGMIYLVGLIAVWFFPETRGKPLPV